MCEKERYLFRVLKKKNTNR